MPRSPRPNGHEGGSDEPPSHFGVVDTIASVEFILNRLYTRESCQFQKY
jgi:hypothetical protein